jgi:O-antigen ligase
LRFDDFVIAMIAIAWLVRLAVFKEAGVLRRTRMSAPILSYIGVCLLATGVGVLFDRVNALTGFFFVAKYFEYVVIYFLVVNYVHDRQQVKRLVAATLITAAIIAVVVLVQIPGGERVTAPFEGDRGEPNTLGGYLVLMIALALAFLSEARDANTRLLWAGFAGIMTVPLVYTYSRTSWLGFVAMLMAVTLLCRTKTLFIVIVLAGLVLLIVSPPEAILERTTYTITGRPAATGAITIGGITIEPSAAARLQSWSIAAEAVPQQPLLGWGVTGFSFIDSQYPRTLIESGLGRDVLRVSTRSFDTAVAVGFLAALAGTIVHGVGANTFIIVRIMEPFWLLAGFTAVLLRLNRQEAATIAAAELGETPPATTRAAPPAPRQATRPLIGRRDLA